MKHILTLLTCCLIGSNCFAQEEKISVKEHEKRHAKMEAKIESRKVGYITTELDLSVQEAEKFWPIYNELSRKRKALRDGGMKKNHKIPDDISEAEAEEVLNRFFDHKQQELELSKEYFGKMESALSKKKIAKLLVAEKRFRKEILAKIRKRMGRKGSRK